MAHRRKAVVLLSGGLGSATVLAIALNEGYEAHTLSFRSGQRYAAALDAARAVALAAGAHDHVVAAIEPSAFLSYALALAETIGSDDVWVGTSGIGYGGRRKRVHTPLIGLARTDVVRLGLGLGVDYSLTRCCHDATQDGHACGHCDACLQRLHAFADNGLTDPAPYRAPLARETIARSASTSSSASIRSMVRRPTSAR